jgi:large subunit ribosomal protein L18
MITVKKRRRLEGKTDYKKRITLLKSKTARIVFRKTNRYVIGQYIKSEGAQDGVEEGVNSKILLSFGWPKEAEGSLKSLPAAYLTGFILGKRVSEKEKAKAIFDIGLFVSAPKSRIFAFLKGVADGGVEVNCSKEVFPDESRTLGRHMKKNIQFDKVKEKIENGFRKK